MLIIRLQRTGRSGLSQFRVVVQDSRTAPSSGKVIAQVGHFDPHTKKAVLNTEKIAEFIKNGAQPSDRAARLFKEQKIKLPDWHSPAPKKTLAIRNPEKLRRNRPAEPEQPAEQTSASEPEASEPAADSAETPAEAKTEESPKTEEAAPAEEAVSEQEAPSETAEAPIEETTEQ